ncbi:uncharacterized protein [Physcomitrium patens]|uniref:uncharacterized protein isoform X2 n=1 Tax=Physcomitrium patens TaxID=3218 RepID=UPI0001624B99|nr:uncharacterized protein LOC112295857 isoform X2 [Physcomitrium patens]|eukprot:XP_024403634.1 uncharacterized protein LOC112295857 isoform X2 [Physcomitrella patens]
MALVDYASDDDEDDALASPSISSLSRKRLQSNGSAHPSHHPKVPRVNSSSARTSVGSTLVPPQLRGRSNVATEDLDKLFVHRQQRRPG